MYSFSCDYLEGAHPAILQALAETNGLQRPTYGEDDHCAHAADLIRARFACPQAAVHFLVGGTQANTTVISSILRPYEGALCADTGHINVHETGAIESTGHKVLAMPGTEGRITGAQIAEAVALQDDDPHMVKPGMVYISLSTELGTIYSRAQLTDVYKSCQAHGLYLFIDGARLGYGLSAETCDLRPEDIPALCDVFTVGGTKQGALFGEAVVIVNPALQGHFRYMIKQRGGMLAKGSLLGIQFEALMAEDRYFSLARHAVREAMRIRQALLDRQLPLLIDSPTNQLFPILTDAQLAALSGDFAFSPWARMDAERSAVRICTSWATRPEAVDQLIAAIKAL